MAPSWLSCRVHHALPAAGRRVVARVAERRLPDLLWHEGERRTPPLLAPCAARRRLDETKGRHSLPMDLFALTVITHYKLYLYDHV